jgi:RNA polymerase sigma-70 factor (ECF subfamily)
MLAIPMTEPHAETLDPLALLAREAGAGSGAAVRSLVQTLAPAVLGVVRVVLGATSPDVEDVTQEALVAFVRSLPSFRGESSVAHYARQIAVKRATDALRSARRRVRTSEEPDESIADASRGPEGAAVAERERRLWRRLLAELPAPQAEALALRVVLGHSIEEIAAATGAPAETVRSRLRLAKGTLRERISREPALAELCEGQENP